MRILIGIPIEESKAFCLNRLYHSLKNQLIPEGCLVGILFMVTLKPSVGFLNHVNYVAKCLGKAKYAFAGVGRLEDQRENWNRESMERARELIRHFALTEYPSDYLWFADADNPPPKPALTRLLGLDADIASGLLYQRMRNSEETYPLIYEYPGPPPKDPMLRPGWEKIGPLKLKNIEGKKGVIEADAVGFGCCLIKREAFKDIPFQSGLMNSEDTEFCHQARLRGYRIKVDSGLHVPHLLGEGG